MSVAVAASLETLSGFITIYIDTLAKDRTMIPTIIAIGIIIAPNGLLIPDPIPSAAVPMDFPISPLSALADMSFS